jgi:hypothetical protein
MTARQGKILSTVMMALIAAAVAAGVAETLVRHRPIGEAAPLFPGAIMIALFATLRSRYARLEAEHGPDHPATRTGGRSLLVALAVAVAIFAGLSTFLLSRR